MGQALTVAKGGTQPWNIVAPSAGPAWVALEATGSWSYVYDLLEPLGVRVTLAHPRRVKEPLAKLLAHVVGLAQEKGIVLGRIQVVYRVHRVADVNVARGKGPGGKTSRRAVAIDDPGKAVLPWTYIKEAG